MFQLKFWKSLDSSAGNKTEKPNDIKLSLRFSMPCSIKSASVLVITTVRLGSNMINLILPGVPGWWWQIIRSGCTSAELVLWWTWGDHFLKLNSARNVPFCQVSCKHNTYKLLSYPKCDDCLTYFFSVLLLDLDGVCLKKIVICTIRYSSEGGTSHCQLRGLGLASDWKYVLLSKFKTV